METTATTAMATGPKPLHNGWCIWFPLPTAWKHSFRANDLSSRIGPV